MISLALGDPTVFGNFNTSSSVVDEVKRRLDDYKGNGYPPSTGIIGRA